MAYADQKSAIAGTLESNDALVEVLPSSGGIEIDVKSIVKNQFGDKIEAAVRSVLDELCVSDCIVRLNDHGALDCVIRARTETAIRRSQEV